MAKLILPRSKEMRDFFANDETSKNGCGHAAVATVIDYFAQDQIFPDIGHQSALVDAIYKQHGTDTPWAMFGCTPGHTENMFKNHGFMTWRRSGFDNHERDLEASIKAGRPMVVTVDYGKLGGNWLGHHYIVVFGIDTSGNVLARNMLAPANYTIDRVTFMDAWHCWSLPPISDWQYAGISVWLTNRQFALMEANLRKRAEKRRKVLPKPLSEAEVQTTLAALGDGKREQGALTRAATLLAIRMDELNAADDRNIEPEPGLRPTKARSTAATGLDIAGPEADEGRKAKSAVKGASVTRKSKSAPDATSRQAAKPIKRGETVQGEIDLGEGHYYKMGLKEGEELTFTIYSKLLLESHGVNGMLTIMDSEGGKLDYTSLLIQSSGEDTDREIYTYSSEETGTQIFRISADASVSDEARVGYRMKIE